jgi:23S rRNA pseudouridine1911/1915/1917 synthase
LKIAIGEKEAGGRLDKIVVSALPGVGRAGAKRLFAEGRVRLVPSGGGRPRRAAKGDVAALGDEVEIDVGAEDAAGGAVPEPGAALEVLLERDDLVVVDKPAGQPTAPLDPGERGTLANALVARYPEMAALGFSPREPGLCHRLDTETSGCVLAARTEAAFDALARALKEGRLDKRYLLLCAAADLPETGTIDVPLAPHPKDRRRVYACVHPRDVARYAPRAATTTYRTLSVHGALALVEASAPKAARHQIRAHFAAIEHPLAGDALYGGPEVPGLARHALHAQAITWGGDAVVPAFAVRSPLPPDLAALTGEADA